MWHKFHHTRMTFLDSGLFSSLLAPHFNLNSMSAWLPWLIIANEKGFLRSGQGLSGFLLLAPSTPSLVPPLSFSLPPSCPSSSLTARPVQASSSRTSANATLTPHFQPTALWSFNFSLSNEYSFQNGMITKKITLHNCFWIGTIYTRMVRFGIGGGGFFFGIYGALK